MEIVIYGKMGCSWCERAKQLCEERGYSYEYLKIGEHLTKEEFLEVFDEATRPMIRSVPQIFVDGHYVGGYDKFADFLKEM